MNTLIFLIPIALFLGALGLGAFLWSLKSGQYDDVEGAAWRVLDDGDAGAVEHARRLPQRRPARFSDGRRAARREGFFADGDQPALQRAVLLVGNGSALRVTSSPILA